MEHVQSSTIIGHQMRYFTRRSVNWWDTSTGLHKYDKPVFEYMKKVLEENNLISNTNGTYSTFKEFKVLDAGCGGGILSEKFAKLGCTVVGIDVNESLINVAKEHKNADKFLTNLSYHLEAIEDHASNNVEKYDVVVLNYVLQHAKHRRLLLNSCIQMLKPGGIFFPSAINRTIAGWLRIVLLEQMIYRVLPSGACNWRGMLSTRRIRKILEENNCTIKECKGLYYSRKSDSVIWSENTNGFYLVYATKDVSR